MYLIGSRALNVFLPTDVERKDWDLVPDGRDLTRSPECDLAPPDLNCLEVCETFDSGLSITTPYGVAKLPHLLGLMLFKRSHLHRPLSFEKHIRDYHRIKDAVKMPLGSYPEYNELLAARIAVTKQKYPDRTPSLKKSKDEFFDDYVTKVYDHDDIHRATCFYDEPIFERLKSDSGTVWCEKSKWLALSDEDKVRCVQEECIVIALERFIIPNLILDKPHMPAKMAYEKAVTKTCTTLTSGWFRDFAIENWPQVMFLNHDFLGLFNERIRVIGNN